MSRLEKKPLYDERKNSGLQMISPKTKRIILSSVIAAHVLLLVGPYLGYLIVKWLRPPVKRTLIITPITEIAPGPSAPPAKLPEPVVKKTEPPPKLPEPVVKKTEPPPEPKTEPPPKPAEKKLLRPSDIIKSETVVTRPDTPPPPNVSAKDLANKFKNAQVRTSPIQISSPQGAKADAAEAQYFDIVASFLYQRWQQPGKGLIGNTKPATTVKVSVDGSGKIIKWAVSKKSGNAAVDKSVEDLFSGLESLPQPPSGAMEFDISMEITDKD